MFSVLSFFLSIDNYLPNRKQMTNNALQLVGRNRLWITYDSILGTLSFNISCDFAMKLALFYTEAMYQEEPSNI